MASTFGRLSAAILQHYPFTVLVIVVSATFAARWGRDHPKAWFGDTLRVWIILTWTIETVMGLFDLLTLSHTWMLDPYEYLGEWQRRAFCCAYTLILALAGQWISARLAKKPISRGFPLSERVPVLDGLLLFGGLWAIVWGWYN